MTTLEYDDSKFVVSKEKDYGEPVGKFRVIRYDTGYYALQRWNVNDWNPEDPSPFAWQTMVIAPQLDTPLVNGYDWKFSQGNLTMNSLLQHLENSSKLQDNELMELHLNLNSNLDEEVSDEIVEIIKSTDGKRIADKVIDSLILQDTHFTEYLDKKYKRDSIILTILASVCVCSFIITILSIYGLI